MINLISQEVKKEISTQYFFRLGTVSFLIVGAFLLLGIALLVPSYFVAQQRENTEIVRAEDLRKNEAFQENKELGELLEDTKKQLRITAQLPQGVISTQFVEPVLEHVESSEATLEHLRYGVQEGVASIELRGTAPNRDALLSLIEQFKNDELFSKVDVPVSSFVQNTNINYTATLEIDMTEL